MWLSRAPVWEGLSRVRGNRLGPSSSLSPPARISSYASWLWTGHRRRCWTRRPHTASPSWRRCSAATVEAVDSAQLVDAQQDPAFSEVACLTGDQLGLG